MINFGPTLKQIIFFRQEQKVENQKTNLRLNKYKSNLKIKRRQLNVKTRKS